MPIQQRAFVGATDLARMRDLVFAFPNQSAHVVDLPYRFCSPAMQENTNITLWEDPQQQLMGFGVLQNPFANLDIVYHPAFPELHELILRWGMDRLNQRAAEEKQPFYFMTEAVEPTSPEKDPIDDLLRRYEWQRADWSLLHMGQSLDRSIPSVELPNGYTIRSLDGEVEVPAYVAAHRAAFESTNMAESWRHRIIKLPGYRPDWDLIVTAPDNTFAAFCIGWLAEVKGELVAQVEPLGVVPGQQRKGLGRAILYENLRRMQATGARTALIEAESNNPASTNLYRSAGFEVLYTNRKYFRRFTGE